MAPVKSKSDYFLFALKTLSSAAVESKINKN